MQYKLVCIDMDGTLLNSKHKVTNTSKEAIRKAHEMGIHIVISTGRMYADAAYFSDFIGVKSPVIASNGALIKEKDGNDTIYKSVMDKDLCLKLLDVFSKYGITPTFYTPEKAYFGNGFEKVMFEFFKLRGLIGRNTKFVYIKSLIHWHGVLNIEKDNIIKCELRNGDINKLAKIRSELEKICEIELASSSTHNIEITCRGVSKGRAVEELADYLNIKSDEIIAIGDSENDLSMIEYAGMGVAMGNAIERVKKKANMITETNDKDGVAKAIDKLILHNT